MSEPAASDAFLEARLPMAEALGRELADLVDEPERFVRALRHGLEAIADPGRARLPPAVESAPVLGVRVPLLSAAERPVDEALREGSSAVALWLAQRLIAEDVREVRAFAVTALRRSLADEPERTWQALRRLGRLARDRVEVDAQAGLWARGVLAERFRWAELEQLVYAERAAERRLVAATLACLPHEVPRGARHALAGEVSRSALAVLADLIGDAEPLVRTAIARAIREWAALDGPAVQRLLRDETAYAAAHDDGHRAWVIRATLGALPGDVARPLRARLVGVRSRPGAPATSPARRRAAAFGSLSELSERALSRQGARYRGT
jgi:hypothetical protein